MLSHHLSKAWKITVKFKILWLFGFIVTIFGADLLSGPSPELSSLENTQSTSFPPFEPTLIEKLFGYLLAGNLKLFAALAITGLIASIVYLFLAVVAEGALAYAVANNEDEDKVRFSKLFSKGLDHFWRLLAINCFLFLAYVGIIMLFSLTILAVTISIFFLIAVLPAFIFSNMAAIFLGIVNNFAKRFVVLDDQNVFRAISEAVRLSWRNRNQTLKLYFTVFSIFVASLIVAGIITSIIYIPFSYMEQNSLKDVSLMLLLLLPLAIMLKIAGGILSVFLSSVWTLGFIDIRQSEAARSRPSDSIDQFQDNEQGANGKDELPEG